MEWTIAEARQRFSELVREAAQEPQIITNRHRAVAALVDVELFAQFQAWRGRRDRSLAEVFAELKEICQEEDYELTVPLRVDRGNLFPEVLDELSGGHQSRQ